MIKIEKNLDIQPSFDFGLLGKEKEELLFFDIETSGLSARTAGLYLIGMADFQDGQWRLTQFFAESMADEPGMLEGFFAKLAEKKLLLSFNGDGFDIPFLERMLAQYGLPYRFGKAESLDLYKYARSAKNLLRLPDLKLKSCERFLGIEREDSYSGRELIRVYQQYLRQPEEETLRVLLLHNEEDIANLPLLLPLLSYSFLLSGSFRLEAERLEPLPTKDGQVLDLLYQPDTSVPRPLGIEFPPYSLDITGQRMELCVRMHAGELKHFFPDYKNYYYLPLEDCAVHRAVSEYMDPAFRKKATAKTAYQRQEGLFLPAPAPIFPHIFQKEYKGRTIYTPYTEGMLSARPELAERYLRAVLNALPKREKEEAGAAAYSGAMD